jgi:peptide/nickel transport system permease protein
MTRFLLRRIALVFCTLVLVSIILFIVAQVLPGDVGRTILGPYATADQVAQLDRELGLDRPIYVRYGNWVGNFVQGRWGSSYLLHVAVRDIALERLKNSVILGGFALALIVPVSVGLGVIAALNHGRVIDRAISIIGVSLIALPEFVTGAIVLVIFAVELRWLPVSSHVPTADPLDWFRQLLLPSIPVMFVLFGYISRMARAGTVEALRSNYTRTAILKGLPRSHVIWSHVLRNALLPTITVISLQTGYLIGGLVVTETLFNYPGIGKLIFDAAIGHDLPILQATVLIVALLYTSLTLTADLLFGFLNPRVRLSA